MALCHACGQPLHPDEIGLTKKLINRGTSTFYCIGCLSRHFQVAPEYLQRKIEEFREMGCVLFAPKAPD